MCAVVESRNIYDRFFATEPWKTLHGTLTSPPHTTKLSTPPWKQIPHAYFRGLAQYSVARSLEGGRLSPSPLVRCAAHPIELAYLATGNVEWMGGRCDESCFPKGKLNAKRRS